MVPKASSIKCWDCEPFLRTPKFAHCLSILPRGSEAGATLALRLAHVPQRQSCATHCDCVIIPYTELVETGRASKAAEAVVDCQHLYVTLQLHISFGSKDGRLVTRRWLCAAQE